MKCRHPPIPITPRCLSPNGRSATWKSDWVLAQLATIWSHLQCFETIEPAEQCAENRWLGTSVHRTSCLFPLCHAQHRRFASPPRAPGHCCAPNPGPEPLLFPLSMVEPLPCHQIPQPLTAQIYHALRTGAPEREDRGSFGVAGHEGFDGGRCAAADWRGHLVR